MNSAQKVGPTFARGLDRLAGLALNVRQGDSYSDMRLDFELSCAIAPLRVSGSDCGLALRSCFVSLQQQNSEVQIGTRYEHWLDDGSFKEHEIKKTISGSSREAGIGVNAGAELTGMAAFAAKVGLGASRKVGSTSEGSIEKSRRTGLIATSGQDVWRVGDPRLGDARRPDGLLDGTYFHERRDGDDPPPLCRLSCIDETVVTKVTATVSASFGSLVILQNDGHQVTSGSIQQGAKTVLENRSKRASLRHENALRAHVAGFVAAKSIREAQMKKGVFVAHNEFLIGQETMFIPPAMSNDSER